jgi:hypothetical protein
MSDIDQLRKDVALTAEREGWSREETLEIGAAIKADIERGDEEALSGWAKQMAWWREMEAEALGRAKGMAQRIRQALDKERRKAA